MNSKSKSRSRLLVLIVITVLLILMVLLVGYRYMRMRLMANIPPPLVLIHYPTNSGKVQDGIGVRVHATARSDDGISRIELWVDGEYIYGEDAAAATSPMVLHTNWIPKGTGSHELIVRAYDSKGIEGVGSLYVRAETAPEELPDVGIEPYTDEIMAEDVPVNDPAGASAPSSGGSDGGGSAPAPAEDGPSASPPADEEPPEAANPDLDLTILEFLFGGVTLFDMGSSDGSSEEEGDSILLTLEGLGLQTDTAYDEVHCYVGIGYRTPRWYPDTDWNQSTDESFAMTGDRSWNIDEYLSGDNAVHIGWPRNEPVNISINCMATTGSGTTAVDLGMAEIIAPPEEWDGITRTVDASLEGSFEFAYRIGQSELVAKDENPDIPAPYNLRINDRRNELEWDWNDPDPTAYDGTVAGFLVYLNDTLVFEVSGQDTRAVRLPFSWFYPPCGVDYAFTVAAYTYPYQAGDWSPPSEPLVITHEPDALGGGCESQFWVEFLTLRTGNIPADNRVNNWAGLIGPVTGSFWSYGVETIFQGYDLLPNQTYSLAEMTMESARMSNRVLVTPTPGEGINVDFDLGEYVGWDGYNDFCHGMHDTHTYDFLISQGFYEGTLLSEEGRGERCQVDYIIYPLDGTPMGSSGDTMPLPQLEILAIRKQPETGFVEWDIRNRGSGAWANQNLLIQFTESDTGLAGPSYTVPEFFAGVGQTVTITSNQMIDSVWDYCFILDPFNEVLELNEDPDDSDPSNIRYCLPKPDLRIEDVQYNYADEVLLIYLYNNGEEDTDLGSSAVDLADVMIQVDLTENAPEEAVQFNTGIRRFSGMLPAGEGIWLEWGLNSDVRSWLRTGYTVSVDPHRTISEIIEMNNAYSVPAGSTIQLGWNGGMFLWYPSSSDGTCPYDGAITSSDYSITVNVYAESEYSNRHIITWEYDGELSSSFETLLAADGWDYNAYSTNFWVEGEESIHVFIEGEHGGVPMGDRDVTFHSEDSWNLLFSEPITPDGVCLPADTRDGGYEITIVPELFGWRDCGCLAGVHQHL